MTEETNTTEAEVQPTATEPKQPEKSAEHMIPKSRLDEVIEQKRKAEERLKEFEDAEARRKEAEMTEAQKLQAAKDKAEADAAQAKAEAQNAMAEANAKLLKSAVLMKASAMGFEHPADAYALMDVSQVKDESDEAGIEAALKSLIGRLPIKTQGDGKGTPKLKLPDKPKSLEKTGRVFTRPF